MLKLCWPGTLRKVGNGRNRFTEQSGSSQTDPKGRDAFEFSQFLASFGTVLSCSYLTLK